MLSPVLEVKVQRLTNEGRLPKFAHPTDLAADLFASRAATIPPGEVTHVETGIAFQLPEGVGAIVQDRSGLAGRAIFTLGGVVDPDYRGEIRVIMANFGNAPIEV